MGARLQYHLLVLAFCYLLATPPPAVALLNIDGTRNQVFVFGAVDFNYDSNIFAQSQGKGDLSSTLSAGAEFKRQAGIIATDAKLSFAYVHFAQITGQNALNPSLSLEFVKSGGRTTGSLTINAYRSSQSDSAVNLRTSSWNFPLNLALKYPVNDRYYFTATSAYYSQRYLNTNALSNYYDFSQSVDTFYVYTSKLDLFGGYRIRVGETDKGRSTDHDFSVGATGGLLAKLNGQIRLGFQSRTLAATRENFNQLSASSSLTWNTTRKFSVSSGLARDFATTALAGTVDTLSANFTATYAYSRTYQLEGGGGIGRNIFLGSSQADRRDHFYTGNLGFSYGYNEHLRIKFGYTYLQNSSTLATSQFSRQNFALGFSSRY